MTVAAAVLLHVPVDLDRATAQRAAREELAKQVYRDAGPGLTERLLRWVYGQLGHLLDRFAGASPGGWLSLVVLTVVLAAVAVGLRLGLGPLRRSAASTTPLFEGRPRTAAEHRAEADRHADAGRWDEAVRDRLRAIIAALEERSVLDPRPGRTADEAAADAGRVLPEVAAELAAAATAFDAVWYGGRSAGPAQDQALRRLDERVQRSRPGVGVPA